MEKRNYKATFIINLRETSRSIDELITWLTDMVGQCEAQVTASEDLGLKDYAYITDKSQPQAQFISIDFTAQGDINAALQSKFKLEKEVKQLLVEQVKTVPQA